MSEVTDHTLAIARIERTLSDMGDTLRMLASERGFAPAPPVCHSAVVHAAPYGAAQRGSTPRGTNRTIRSRRSTSGPTRRSPVPPDQPAPLQRSAVARPVALPPVRGRAEHVIDMDAPPNVAPPTPPVYSRSLRRPAPQTLPLTAERLATIAETSA